MVPVNQCGRSQEAEEGLRSVWRSKQPAPAMVRSGGWPAERTGARDETGRGAAQLPDIPRSGAPACSWGCGPHPAKEAGLGIGAARGRGPGERACDWPAGGRPPRGRGPELRRRGDVSAAPLPARGASRSGPLGSRPPAAPRDVARAPPPQLSLSPAVSFGGGGERVGGSWGAARR